jgi:Cu/Ag efflux protein CusF
MQTPTEKWKRLCAGLTASTVLFLSGTAVGQSKPAGCENAGTPEKVEGQIIKIDVDQGKVTLRAPNGTTYEFQVSKETLQGYKVGEHIQAKLRSAPNCKPSTSG